MLANEPTIRLDWPNSDATVTPFEIFTRQDIFEEEQSLIFRGPVWSYLGLECEIPNAYDFLTTYVGTTPIVLCRGEAQRLNAFVNRCAHRGNQVVREIRGNAKFHTCIYHKWMYDTEGSLISATLQHGIDGKGGLPEDFDKADHCLQKLRVDSHAGMVFGTFSDRTPPLLDYLGPVLAERMSFVLKDGRIRVNGYHRHTLKCNWKMMAENSRDMYHAPQLHQFFEVFGLCRNADEGTVQTFDNGHALETAWSERSDDGAPVSRSELTLEDDRVVTWFEELDGMTMSVANIFPIGLITLLSNALSTRQLRPKKVDELELYYTWLTYEDDDDVKLEGRRQQRNIFGPAGLVAAEDALVFELIQKSIKNGSVEQGIGGILQMGGRGLEDTDYFWTEAPVRGFYKRYAELMGFDVVDVRAAE